MKKKKKDTMTGVAVGGIIGINVVGATAGLTPSASTIKFRLCNRGYKCWK